MSDADFSDLSRVGLAHTTITDEDIPVQIYADLIHFVIFAYVADREVYSIQFHDLKDMTDSVLNGMGFDDLIALAEDHMNDRDDERPADETEKEQNSSVEMPSFTREKEKPKRRGITRFHPEVPTDDRINYRIENTAPVSDSFSASEKYRDNVAAIRLLKKLEEEDRLATGEEQQTLARYVGWGGLADCFEESNVHERTLYGLKKEMWEAKALAKFMQTKEGLMRCEDVLQPYREPMQKAFDEMLSEIDKCFSYEEQSAGRLPELNGAFEKARVAFERKRLALSTNNPWVKLFSNGDVIKELDKEIAKKYIDKVYVEKFKSVELIPRFQEWKTEIPKEWLEACYGT